MRINGKRVVGSDQRPKDEGKFAAPPSVDISTDLIATRIEAMHRRLLEGATCGRLTWVGDRISATWESPHE